MMATFFVAESAFCQIEFIENKGQWNKEVKFMSLAGSGAFYLQQNGFTVAQHNPDDIENIKERVHRQMTGTVPQDTSKQGPFACLQGEIPEFTKTRRYFRINPYHLLIIILLAMTKVNGHPVAEFSRELPIKMFIRG